MQQVTFLCAGFAIVMFCIAINEASFAHAECANFSCRNASKKHAAGASLAKPQHNRILHRDKDACFIPNSARIGNAHSWSIGKQLHVLPPILSTIPVIELNNSAWFPVPFKPAEAGHICVLWSSACQKQACPNAGPVGQQDHQIMLLKAIIVVVAHNMAIFSPVAFQEETHCEAVATTCHCQQRTFWCASGHGTGP